MGRYSDRISKANAKQGSLDAEIVKGFDEIEAMQEDVKLTAQDAFKTRRMFYDDVKMELSDWKRDMTELKNSTPTSGSGQNGAAPQGTTNEPPQLPPNNPPNGDSGSQQ